MSKRIKKYWWVLFFAVGTLGSVLAHQPEGELPSSFHKQINNKTFTQKIDWLLNTAQQQQYKDESLALEVATLALDFATESNDLLAEAKSRFWLTTISLNQDPESNQLAYLLANAEIAASIFEQKKDIQWQLRSMELVAATAEFIAQHREIKQRDNYKDLARKNINQAFDKYQNLSPSLKRSSIYAQLLSTKASIYYSSRPDSAMIWWLEAEDIFQQKRDTIGLAIVNFNKALLTENTSQQESYFNKSIQLHQQLNNQAAIYRAQLNYGTACIKNYFWEKKIHWWEKGMHHLHQALEAQGQQDKCILLNALGFAYETRHQQLHSDSEPAVDSANYYFNRAILYNQEENNTNCLTRYLLQKKRVCQRNNNCDDFFKHRAETMAGVLEIHGKTITKAIQEKEQFLSRMQEQEAKQKRNQLLLSGLFIALIVGLITKYFFQQQKIKRLQSEAIAQNARIQALGARMNPHFISNTLNAIDSMIYTNQKAEASKYLVEFAKLSRKVLSNSENTLIPLKKEIEMLRHYITLEEMRFKNQLSIHMEVSNQLNSSEIYLPPMLIQPFIENAVIHGIQPKQSPGKINILFKEIEQNKFICIIEDDGIGRAKAKELQQQSAHHHQSYSMAIAEDRINLINNTKGASLEIEDLYNNERTGIGTKVKITLAKNLKHHG